MEPPMTSRLHRVVTALFVLAVGAQAADVIELKGARTTVRFAVADELQVTGKKSSRLTPVVAGGRAAVQAAARHLLGSGAAAKVEAVVYLDGRIGEPEFRAIATRRILLAAAPGQDVARLAADHGLTLVEPVRGQTGWWMAEPRSPDVYAAIDATRSLARDARTALVWPQMQMPVAERYLPNDPMRNTGYLWHITNAATGIRVQESWDLYRGTGTNIAILDGGVQGDHLDLYLNYRGQFSWDYINSDNDPFPSAADPADNHGTAIAGLAAAVGDNGIGTTGVAWGAGIIASKVLNSYGAGRNETATDLGVIPVSAATDAFLRLAMAQSLIPTSVSQEYSVANCSWGPIDNSLNHGAIGPLTLTGMREAVTLGRNGKGVPLVFPAGNGGWVDPNALRDPPPFGPFPLTQDCTSFDGYLNRYTIGVAAYQPVPLTKAFFSESGPNLTISAPGVGVPTTDRSIRRVANTNPIFDNLGYTQWPWIYGRPNANFDGTDRIIDTNGDGVVDLLDTPFQYVWQDPVLGLNPLPLPYPDYLSDPDNLTFENGDYVQGVTGTSVAAPLVSGAAALMIQARPDLSWLDVRQIMMHRGQDRQLPAFPTVPTGTIYKEGTGSHTWWGHWRNNFVGLAYNNWYGFGTIDVGRFIFGGTGNLADRYATTARDEPGALRWPLMPAMQVEPITFEATYALPVSGDTGYPNDPKGIYDAPLHLPYPIDNVPDGLNAPMDLFSRICSVAMPVTGVPPRFRVDAVELTVTLLDVGATTYAPTAVPPPSSTGASWGEYQVWLTSPNGTTALMGRQRPGVPIPTDNTLTVTMTELFHTNELIADGTWTFRILDEVNNAVGHPNAIQARVHALGLKIYGHQTYATPSLAAPAKNGVASDEGTQIIELPGTGFARSGGGIDVTQVYWQPTAPTAGPAVEIQATVVSETSLRAYVPASLLNPASPGTANVFLANPALVVGRAAGLDAFDTPNTLLPTTVEGTPADRYMKRCPVGDDRQIRYSRRPTLTPMTDLSLPNGGTFPVSTVAFDADVAAGLGIPTAETLTLSIVSYNPYFIPLSNISVTGPGISSSIVKLPGKPEALVVTPNPGFNGNGTYVINVTTVGSSSGFALIEVTASDGVLSTNRAFRVIIPTDEDPNSCGGGMGLALLGLPLAAWFIRRRRRS